MVGDFPMESLEESLDARALERSLERSSKSKERSQMSNLKRLSDYGPDCGIRCQLIKRQLPMTTCEKSQSLLTNF